MLVIPPRDEKIITNLILWVVEVDGIEGSVFVVVYPVGLVLLGSRVM